MTYSVCAHIDISKYTVRHERKVALVL